MSRLTLLINANDTTPCKFWIVSNFKILFRNYYSNYPIIYILDNLREHCIKRMCVYLKRSLYANHILASFAFLDTPNWHTNDRFHIKLCPFSSNIKLKIPQNLRACIKIFNVFLYCPYHVSDEYFENLNGASSIYIMFLYRTLLNWNITIALLWQRYSNKMTQ